MSFFHSQAIARRLVLSLVGSACIATLATPAVAAAEQTTAPPAVTVDALQLLAAAGPRSLATSVAPWRRARAGQTPLDTDLFLVRPPAGARWSSQSAR